MELKREVKRGNGETITTKRWKNTVGSLLSRSFISFIIVVPSMKGVTQKINQEIKGEGEQSRRRASERQGERRNKKRGEQRKASKS